MSMYINQTLQSPLASNLHEHFPLNSISAITFSENSNARIEHHSVGTWGRGISSPPTIVLAAVSDNHLVFYSSQPKKAMSHAYSIFTPA